MSSVRKLFRVDILIASLVLLSLSGCGINIIPSYYQKVQASWS